MITKQTILRAGCAAAGAAVVLGAAFPVFAQTLNANANVNANVTTGATTGTAGTGVQAGATADAKMSTKAMKLTQREEKAKTRDGHEIDRRVDGLNKLITQINGMKRLSDSQKATLAASLQGQISALQTLKTKINADVDQDTLKTDGKSITDSYRIYALVIPQGQIIASADRLFSISDTMVTLGTKLQTQIATAKTNGKDVTAAQTAFTDFSAKITDANTQAQAAVSGVVSLVPDQGDKTKMAQNQQALKDARAKLRLAEADLQAARKDATTIVKSLHINTSVTASTNTSQTTTTK